MENLNNVGESIATDIQFAVAESYKTIRTNLQFLLANNIGCKAIAVSSPKAGDGKTTNAINIAIAFSQLGKRVLLIDADMRRPSIQRKLKTENTDGLSGVLAGFASADNAIVTVNSSLDVLPTGATPPNPSEMLASPAYERLIDSLRLAYDYIIIDTPPVGIVSDTLSAAAKTDGLLIILKENVSRYSDFEKVLDNIKLSGVKLLGVVLNSSAAKNNYDNYKSTY